MSLVNLIVVGALLGSAHSYPVRVPVESLLGYPINTTYIDETTFSYYEAVSGVLGTDNFEPLNQFQLQPYVANGFLGARIPNLGFGFTEDQNLNSTSDALSNGWPLFDSRISGAYMSGFFDLEDQRFPSTNFPELYDKGYESVISVIPQWTDLSLSTVVNGTNFTLNPRLTNTTSVGPITNYTQELNIKTGVVVTTFKWLNLIEVSVTVILHRDFENLGLVHVELRSDEEISVDVENFIDFQSSRRCDFVQAGDDGSGIYMTFSPHLVRSTNGTIYSRLDIEADLTNSQDNQFVSQRGTLQLYPGVVSEFTKYSGVSSTDESSDPFQSARSSALMTTTVEHLLNSHKLAWSNLLNETSITVPSSDLLTLASRLSLYHLLANQRASSSGVRSALGVGGLSSDSYAGMQFWDTDLWMIPAMSPFAPEIAHLVSKYRIYTHNQARRNAEENGRPGAVYPWTSGRYGNCTSTGPCYDYEYHINVAITYSAWKLYLSGAISDSDMSQDVYPLFRDTADFFVDYVNYNDTLGKYTTHNLTDPDEYANQVDNGAYTNVGISQLLKWSTVLGNHLNLSVNPQWDVVSKDMFLPSSEYNITLEYDTMNSSIEVKQADVILISGILDDEDGALELNFDYNDDQLIRDLNYYSDHQSAQGPAMTFPVFSMVSGKLNRHGCSMTSYLYKSVEPFLRFPFAQMSEQNFDDFNVNGGTHPAFPFLTGHGGILQNVVYGLAGLKFGYELQSDSIVKKLLFDPVLLPCLPGGLQIEGFQYQGAMLSISITDTEAVIEHQRGNNSVIIEVNERNENSGRFTLEPGMSLQFSLFKPAQNVAGSLTECSAQVIYSSESIHGDVTQVLNDGDNSTTWQSSEVDESYLVFDLGDSFTNVGSGQIIWGSYPARLIDLFTSPDVIDFDTINNTVWQLDNYPVEISNQFDVEDTTRIAYLPLRNVTNFQIPPTDKSTRYVLLRIHGSYSDSEGAIISEFNVFQ